MTSRRVQQNPADIQFRGWVKPHADPEWLRARLDWGWTLEDIAADAEVATLTVGDTLRHLGLPVPCLEYTSLRPCDLHPGNCAALVAAGARAQDFARWVGTTRANIHRMFDIAGIRLPDRAPMYTTNRWGVGARHSRDEFVAAYWIDGRTLADIAEEWGVSKGRLSVWADGWGVPRRRRGRKSRHDETHTGE